MTGLTVRCIASTLGDVPEKFLSVELGVTRQNWVPLTVGREYVVYAVTAFLGGFWYYVLDDDRNAEPIWYPSPVFEIVDGRIPEHWRLGQQRVWDSFRNTLSFPAWADDPFFYERLYNEEADAVAAFQEETRIRSSSS